MATSREALGVSGETAFDVPSLAVPPSLGRARHLSRREPPRPSGCSSSAPRRRCPPSVSTPRTRASRRRDLPAARRDPARPGAGGGPGQRPLRRGDRAGSRRPVPAPHGRTPDGGPAPADAAGARRLELGPARARRTSGCCGGWRSSPAAGRSRRPRRSRASRTTPVRRPTAWPASTSSTAWGAWSTDRSSSQRTTTATRYGMLETIRQYSADRLVASGEATDLRTRHLARFRRLALDAQTGLTSPDMIAWLGRLEAEIDNLRAALDWAFETDERAALEMCVALGELLAIAQPRARKASTGCAGRWTSPGAGARRPPPSRSPTVGSCAARVMNGRRSTWSGMPAGAPWRTLSGETLAAAREDGGSGRPRRRAGRSTRRSR